MCLKLAMTISFLTVGANRYVARLKVSTRVSLGDGRYVRAANSARFRDKSRMQSKVLYDSAANKSVSDYFRRRLLQIGHVTGNGYYFVTANDVKSFFKVENFLRTVRGASARAVSVPNGCDVPSLL